MQKDSRVYIVKETEISEVLTKGYTDDLDIDFAKQKVEELTERIQKCSFSSSNS